MPIYTRLNGIKTVDENGLIEQLQENLMEFFNWGLLEAGGYTDVGLDANYDVDDNTLLPKHISGQPDGRIWQATHRNWIWESGLESVRQPVQVSGVYVDGTFHSSDSTDGFKHYVNYPEGRIVFDTPIPTSSVVQAEYSYRWVNFYDQNVPWFRDVVFDSMRYELGDSTQPSGVVGLLQQNAVQLPAVIVESVASRTFIPKQFGDLSQWVYQDFIFHIIAENLEDRDYMVDVIGYQKDFTFYLFDTNARRAAHKFALDWHGAKIPGGMTYPQLVDEPPTGFRWKKCTFNKIVGQESSARLPLYRAIIRITLEVDGTPYSLV